MTNMTDTEIRKLVEDVVAITLAKLGRDGFPFCMAEADKLNALDKKLETTNRVLMGNGNPENGLVYQFAASEVERKADHKMLSEIRTGFWSVGLIGLGLLATSLWQIITQ